MRRAVDASFLLGWLIGLPGLFLSSPAAVLAAPEAGACPREQAVYLTFDTGHMGVAPLVAEVLRRQKVRASFFLANEATLEGGSSLDANWASWWRDRAAEGHVFASHTWDHWVWKGPANRAADAPARGPAWWFAPTAGPMKGKRLRADAGAYCAQLRQPLDWLRGVAPQARIGHAFRAPAGRTSPDLLAVARACGHVHIPWTDNGFLGDELPSERFSNAVLLEDALRKVKPGDILLAHLGIWSRRDPWAPAVLEPLIRGLKARGRCFATLDEHPVHGTAWSRQP